MAISVPSVVHPPRTVGPPTAPGGGTRWPAGGDAPPREAAAPAPEPAPPVVDPQAAVERINAYMQQNQRSLRFRVDESSGRTIITVVNPETQEVVREIPPEDLLALGRWIDQATRGLLLRARA
ncbi:MAG: flagellar protein FlaG [Steroidobacteraceae bacterium]